MAYQLVYTSAAKLLDAGRSGFGTVARSKAVTPLAVSAIERVSQFSNLRGNDRSRMVFVHRRVIAANHRFHLLSRICDAGADYTGRTHHIAHHLIVSQDEVARAAARGLTPADVLRQFSWLDRWHGAARFLDSSDDVHLTTFQPLGQISQRAEWTRLTGNPAHARTLAWEGAPRTGVLLVPRGTDPLALLGEALYEFGLQSWSRSFTTSLETTDELSDIDWVISSPEHFPEIQGRCGARAIVDLNHPQTLAVPPAPVVAATPQAAPAKGGRNFTGGDPFADGIAATSQSGTSPAYSPIPEMGRGAVALVHSRPGPDAQKRTRRMILAGCAASVLIAGSLAAVLIGRNDRPAGSGPSAAPAPAVLSGEMNREIDNLVNIGFTRDFARDLVVKAGPKYNSAWGEFIISSNKLFQALSKPECKFALVPPFPRIPPTESLPGADWTGTLFDLVSRLGKEKDVRNDDWILAVSICHKPIKAIMDAHGLPLVESNTLESGIASVKSKSEICSDQVVRNLFLYFADKRLDVVLKEPLGLLGGLLQAEGCWDRKKYPERYNLVTSRISAQIGDYVASPGRPGRPGRPARPARFKVLFNEVDDNKEFFGPDFDGLKEFQQVYVERDFGEAKLKQLSPDKQNLIANSALVPDSIKNYFRQTGPAAEHPGTGAAAAGHPNGQSPVAVKTPPKRMILVSRDGLKDGVEVALLKELLGRYPGEALKKNGLTILLGDEPVGKELSRVSSSKDCFSESFLGKPGDLRIYTDGRVSIDREAVGSIKLSYKSADKTWETFVVVNDKNPKPLVGDLKFNCEPKDADCVIIKGELAQWLVAVENPGSPDPGLMAALDPAISDLRLVEGALKRESVQHQKPFFLSQRDVKSVRKSLEDFLKADESLRSSRKTEEKKKELDDERHKKLNELKDSLVVSIGGALLAKALGVQDESQIKEAHWKQSAEILMKHYKGNEERAKHDRWDKDIKDIKEKIGEDQLDKVIDNSGNGKGGWDKLQTRNTAAFQGSIKNILDNTKAPGPAKSLGEEIKSIKSITVQTRSGRVLFKATRQD